MTKRLITLFLMVILLLGGFSVVRAGEYYSEQEIDSVVDPLSRYTVNEEVNGFFAKIRQALKPLNEKTHYWWVNYIKPKLIEYLENIKARVKQGIEEERAELQNKFWRSIKELIK